MRSRYFSLITSKPLFQPTHTKAPNVSAYHPHSGASLLKAAAAVMTSNAQITSELADLHGALGPWGAVPNSTTNTTTLNLPAKEPMATTGGSRAGSDAMYEQIMKRKGHGRLGRTHMDDVDRLPETARSELDTYLRRTINAIVPVGSTHGTINADAVFATISAFGLGLEDRHSLADVVIFNDADHENAPAIARLRNSSAHYYSASTNIFEKYWKGSALETIIELARYRGLFGDDGFLKPVEE